MKYVVMSYPAPTIKSIQELVGEHVRNLAEQHDLTSAYVRGLQKVEELEGVSQPIWPGQGGMLPRRPYRR